MSRSLTDIPLDILLYVYGDSDLSPPDLASIVLVCRSLNQLLTPLLYRSIHLSGSFHRCFLCCRTLATSQGLAELVHTLETSPSMRPHRPSEGWDALAALLAVSLPKMRNLQHYLHQECRVSPELYAALCTATRLRTITIPMHIDIEPADDAGKSVVATLDPYFPDLDTLEIRNDFLCTGEIYPPYTTFLQRMISNSAKTLRTLRLRNVNMDGLLSDLIPEPVVLSALENLAVTPVSLKGVNPAQVPNVRFLYYYHSTFSPPPSLPKGLFPHLEHFSGAAQDVPAIFQLGCPLRTVKLNGGHHRMFNEVTFSLPTDWRSISHSLSYLHHCSGHVQDLDLYVGSFDLIDLPDIIDVDPTIKNIQTLVIHLESDPSHVSFLDSLGEKLFSKMSQLRGFALSDKSMSRNSPHRGPNQFWFAQDLEMQRRVLLIWESFCPSLQTVRFTSKTLWSKTKDTRMEWMNHPFHE